jgi:polyhydroxybutyrate depolymerase
MSAGQIIRISHVGLVLALFAILLACVPSAAAQTCGGTPGRTGTIEIKQGTMTRIFVVRVPASYDGRTPLPMVMAFHPGGMSAQYMQGRVPVHRAWPEAIAVFPEGFPNLGGGRGGLQPMWQGAPGALDNRDLVYFDQMLEWLRANHCFDMKKLFVMGYSNGAGFVSVLACERANLLAGVAIASGRAVCNPAQPKPTILSHGMSDATIAYGNGVEAAAGWSARNRCGAPPRSGVPGCFAADSCSEAPLTFCTFDGGHEYNEPFTKTFVEFFKHSIAK